MVSNPKVLLFSQSIIGQNSSVAWIDMWPESNSRVVFKTLQVDLWQCDQLAHLLLNIALHVIAAERDQSGTIFNKVIFIGYTEYVIIGRSSFVLKKSS